LQELEEIFAKIEAQMGKEELEELDKLNNEDKVHSNSKSTEY
jgi:hypothetical protein